jgi:hypothetical protein
MTPTTLLSLAIASVALGSILMNAILLFMIRTLKYRLDLLSLIDIDPTGGADGFNLKRTVAKVRERLNKGDVPDMADDEWLKRWKEFYTAKLHNKDLVMPNINDMKDGQVVNLSTMKVEDMHNKETKEGE